MGMSIYEEIRHIPGAVDIVISIIRRLKSIPSHSRHQLVILGNKLDCRLGVIPRTRSPPLVIKPREWRCWRLNLALYRRSLPRRRNLRKFFCGWVWGKWKFSSRWLYLSG